MFRHVKPLYKYKGKQLAMDVRLVQVLIGTAVSCRWGTKDENLVPNKLIRVKFPPHRDNEVYISRESLSSEGMQGITFQTSALLSLYGGNVTLIT